MKNIDVKSLLIGVLATALLIACADADKTLPSIVSEAKAATGVNDKWDANQQWEVSSQPRSKPIPVGREPFAVIRDYVWIRQRVK